MPPDLTGTLYILQGIPGSGKSTVARALEDGLGSERCAVFSTDDYWGDTYDFDVTKLAVAHAWNRLRVTQAMDMGVPNIVVDNTNLSRQGWEPYLALCAEYAYVPQLLRVEVELPIALARNKLRPPARQVPEAIICKMYDQMRIAAAVL